MSKQKLTKQKPSLLWPLLLIAIGVIMLLSNLGVLPPDSIDLLWRFWPLILVVIGVDILLGRRTAISSIVTSFVAIFLLSCSLAFVFMAQNTPELMKQIDLGELKQETIRLPRNEIKSAEVFIDWPPALVELYPLSDSNNLIEGTLNYHGNLHFDTKLNGDHAKISLDTRLENFLISTRNFDRKTETWRVGLHPDVSLDLRLDAGSGSGHYNLQGLTLNKLTIDAGSGPLDIILPDSGRITGMIEAGSGAINLMLPTGMEAKITLDEEDDDAFYPTNHLFRATTNINDDDEKSVWVSKGFEGADNYIELEIETGSGAISIKSDAE